MENSSWKQHGFWNILYLSQSQILKETRQTHGHIHKILWHLKLYHKHRNLFSFYNKLLHSGKDLLKSNHYFFNLKNIIYNINIINFFYIRQPLKLFKLLFEASIFKTEYQSVKESLIFFKIMVGNKILIISDFLTALLDIDSPYLSINRIQKIHSIVNSTQKTIEFLWILSHMCIIYR